MLLVDKHLFRRRGNIAHLRRYCVIIVNYFFSDKARTLVLGTPIHKQKHGWHIQQQERRRLRDNVQPDVQTVAESPLKGIVSKILLLHMILRRDLN